MTSDELKSRTKLLGLRIIRLAESLPRNRTGNVIANQILRAGTSVGANYRAACKARSRVEFIAKLGVVEEEADEVVYWLELMVEAKLITSAKVSLLLKEANEISAIIGASRISAKRNLSNK